ncbi:type III toxin-antitoxin system ToxN/AbiQ family toxin [Phaeobacter sp. CAU 1743]|uniref:type III toxin-antitoxin system ToxN/AbiQ family toxin n=1 Tax=Phaeobacter sp. CAU 1743 TaxID=3140367 RepID=UPI00325BE604
MSELKFYTVSTAYLDHLHAVEPRVYYAQGTAYINAKPYVGIVLDVSGHKFLAPLTSYKPKHDRIKSSNVTVFKLHERGNPNNKLGMISLNNMIPVPDTEITLLDMASQSERYRRMLYKQYEFIKENAVEIKDRAAKLHYQVTALRTPFYVRLSCDFTILVDASRRYVSD